MNELDAMIALVGSENFPIEKLDHITSPLQNGTLDESGLVLASAEVCCADNQNRHFSSIGKGPSRVSRELSALMELFERIAIVKGPPHFKTLAISALRETHVDPRTMMIEEAPSSEHGILPYSVDLPVDWTPARHLVTKETRLVHRPRRFHNPGFFAHTSSGVAAGFSFAHAQTTGLFELVERDALMLHWLCQIPARSLVVETSPVLEQAEAWLTNWGFDLRCFDISTDLGIPVVLALCSNRERVMQLPPGAAITGCAARGSLGEACEQAVLEVIQALECLLLVEGDSSALPGMSEHIVRYLSQNSIDHFQFLEPRDSTRARLGWPSARIARGIASAEMLYQRGYDCWCIDNNFEFEKLKIYVSETVVPGLLPLTLGTAHSTSRFSSPRLAAALRCLERDYVCTLPHPLG